MFEEWVHRKVPRNVQERLEFAELLSLIRDKGMNNKEELVEFLEIQIEDSKRLFEEGGSATRKRNFARRVDYFEKMLKMAKSYL
tara:strand:- start:352 stop:603 length:252 start_codon:yes stop_codon:yes gene_type:complete